MRRKRAGWPRLWIVKWKSSPENWKWLYYACTSKKEAFDEARGAKESGGEAEILSYWPEAES